MNYCGMAVKYHGMCVFYVIKHNLTSNGNTALWYFNPRNVSVKITEVIYRGIFITTVPGANVIKQYRGKLPW